MIPSITGAVVVSSLTGLMIHLAIVPIPVTDAQVINDKNSSNITKPPVSEEERQRYLDRLQSETTSTMIPALVFLSILVVAGAVGNSLVIFVYSHKLQWSATRILIVTLAMLDLVANIIAIPGEMYDMFHIWDFNNPALCRARLYCSTFSTVSSAMILVAVAVTRYRKVCHPHKGQITIRTAKVISLVLASLGALVSVPYAILNGRQTKKTPRSDIHAYECTTDDAYVNTNYPLANYTFFLVMYISCSVSLTVLYILIGAKAWKHSKIHGASPSRPSPASESATSSKYSSKYSSKIMKQSSNQNECKCTKCGSSYNLDTSITRESATQSLGDIEMKRVSVGNEASEVPLQYKVRVVTDTIEVWTPVVGEFLVKLQQSSLENNQYNPTENETSLQIADGNREKRTPVGIHMVKSNDSSVEMVTFTSSHGDIVSNSTSTESCTDAFLDKEETSDAVRTNDKINEEFDIFHSKENSRSADQVCNSHIFSLRNGANNDIPCPTSIQTAANEVKNVSDHLSDFKWLDVIYCPADPPSTVCSYCVQRESSLSLRLPINNLLEKTEWLRISVIEEMTRQDETAEVKSDENILAVNSIDTSSNGSDIYRDSGATKSVHPQHNTNSAGNRLREILTKKLSSFKNLSQRTKTRRRPIGRTTIMLIIISVIYILGYLPHLTLMLFKFLSPDAIANMSTVDLTFYNLFLRTYFLNCAANPVVYSLCDSNFRRACFKLIKCL